jgi:carbamate kinase
VQLIRRGALPRAQELGADQLLMLTDAPYVQRDWGTPSAARIRETTASELRSLSFADGSMGPKVEAACRFVERTGGEPVIGALAELGSVARGESGTRIRPAFARAVA